MKTRSLAVLLSVFALVSVSYTTAAAQEDNTEKSSAEKVKESASKVITKSTVVVTDGLEKAADKTKEVAAGTVKAGAKTAKSFGNNAVEVTENVVGKSQESGKWFAVTTWNGAKWVTKRVWYPNKKPAGQQN